MFVNCILLQYSSFCFILPLFYCYSRICDIHIFSSSAASVFNKFREFMWTYWNFSVFSTALYEQQWTKFVELLLFSWFWFIKSFVTVSLSVSLSVCLSVGDKPLFYIIAFIFDRCFLMKFLYTLFILFVRKSSSNFSTCNCYNFWSKLT